MSVYLVAYLAREIAECQPGHVESVRGPKINRGSSSMDVRGMCEVNEVNEVEVMLQRETVVMGSRVACHLAGVQITLNLACLASK